MSLPSDKLTWMLAGVGTILAIYTTYWQLESFKKRTIIKPSGTRSVGVEQSTEDAIKLSTLAVLARGVNPELRGAALKILCERALKGEALAAVLDKAESADLSQNFAALRVLGLLLQNSSPRRLVQPRVFKAILSILRRSSASAAASSSDLRCQREALSLLSRLISLGDAAQQYAIDAGLIEWIRESRNGNGSGETEGAADDGSGPGSGYDALFATFFDMNRNDPIDQSLYELLRALSSRGARGRDRLLELGLLANLGGTASSGRPFELENDDWVEVVEAAAQAATEELLAAAQQTDSAEGQQQQQAAEREEQEGQESTVIPSVVFVFDPNM